jgi:hypothetical protein
MIIINQVTNNEISNEIKESSHFIDPIYITYRNQEVLSILKDHLIMKLSSLEVQEPLDIKFYHNHQLKVKIPMLIQVYLKPIPNN